MKFSCILPSVFRVDEVFGKESGRENFKDKES